MTVLVCGGGLGGLVAGLAAQEGGSDAVIVDKAERIGGSALMSGGYIWTIADRDVLERTIPHGNPALQQLVFDGLDDGAAWLRGLGVPLRRLDRWLEVGHGYQMDPNEAFPILEDRFREQGGRILVRRGLTGLRLDEGAIAGAEVAVVEGRTTVVPADAVVIATGGFQGNPRLVQDLLGVDPAHVYLRSNPWSTGDGLEAATAAGALLSRGLSHFYGHAMAAEPARFPPSLFGEATQFYGSYGVALNTAGRRFADEAAGSGEEVLNQAVARQPRGLAVYVIDARVARGEALPGLLACSTVLERAEGLGARVYRAETLTALCELLVAEGLPPEDARRTLEEYNEAVRDGATARIHPPRSGAPTPLTEPPFTAVAVRAGITFTMGGLAVDEQMRVLRRSSSSSPMATAVVDLSDYRPDVVPGLFAAGADVGDISHESYMGGLSVALTTGRVAGAEAAAHASTTPTSRPEGRAD